MRFSLLAGLAAVAILGGGAPVAAADVTVLLPRQRTAYQTNERIDLAVVRSGDKDLAAGDLVLTARGADGSALAFTFPVKAARAASGPPRSVEHLHLSGWL